MSISRSIATLLLQGMKLCLLADADILAFTGSVRVGPLVPDPLKGDTIVAPRQINLMIAPNIAFAGGVGGTSNADIPVIVAFYDFIESEAFDASSGTNAYDRFEHIQKVLMNGSDATKQGKILNPDDPTNVSNIIKYLNVKAPEFRTTIMGALVTNETGAFARCYAMIANYETREDIYTRGRA